MGLCRSMGTPVHLRKALEGLALDPALPEDLIRRLIAHREAPAELGARPDLTPELIDEMIADGRLRMPRSRASNDGLPGPVRLRLAAHPDISVGRARTRHPRRSSCC
jgi:hypothetical protein